MNKVDKYLMFSIGFLVLYTIVNIILAIANVMIPSELTVAVFAFFGTEIASCAFIKKVNSDKDKEDE